MTRLLITPAARFSVVLCICVLMTIAAVMLALEHRHWNIDFPAGSLVQSNSGQIEIEALDRTPEPGIITQDDELRRFYQRQQQLTEVLSADTLVIQSVDDQQTLEKRSASPGDLHLLFWVQLTVGLGALVIAGWVWALRRGDLAARLFALSGLATMMFTFSAAIYTTRELALPESLFRTLVGANVFGASLFGIAMIALFLVYPVRLRFWRGLLVVQAAFFGLWTGLSMIGFLPAWAGVNLITLTEMLIIVIALVAQFVATRGQPTARASLSWLGLSVLAGAGGFIILNALPLVLGTGATVDQGVAFLFFLVIYLGLAAGITRYRLFDVGGWAFTFLFYALGAFLLVLLDAALIFLIGVDRLPALGLSFFAVALLYLPMRDVLQRFFRKTPEIRNHELLDAAMQVALVPSSQEREAHWKVLMRRLFEPLEVVEELDNPTRGGITDNGTALVVPAVAGIPALRLMYPRAGKALFPRQSEELTQQLVTLVERAASNRDAYEKGIREERSRVAQDLHDDVAARLLDGLHADERSLRIVIQEAMADIRSIVRGITGQKAPLADVLADLRAEAANRLEAADLELIWPTDGYDDARQVIDYRFHKNLGSIIREVISNTIRHADASRLDVLIRATSSTLEIECRDNGRGLPESVLHGETGFGLKGMERRVQALSGRLSLPASDQGTVIVLSLPFQPTIE